MPIASENQTTMLLDKRVSHSLYYFCFKEGERVAERLKKAGRKLNVEANTALLKGYAHSGEIEKAIGLFEAMCTTKGMMLHML